VFELVRLGDQFHLESIIEGCVDLINTALELDLGMLKMSVFGFLCQVYMLLRLI